jgi:glycosyltransferase involved in cell wall biosynthesis
MSKSIMNRPMVSVVMPVFNAENYLEQAIESILNQSYTNLDIVIINDGSTDNSKNIILNFEDKRLRYFENPVNWGIVKTRNRCLEEARGKYIAVLDSDDIAFPERIKEQVEFLENNPDYGMCGSYFQTIDGNGKFLKNVRFPSNDKDARTYLIVHNCFCHSTIMMRSKLAKEFQYLAGYDVAEDYLLWYEISKITKIINLPVYTTFYRVHQKNISTTKNNVMFGIVNKINARILDDLNIKYSPEELEIHSNSLRYNDIFFKNKSEIQKLENWISKLYKEVKKNENLNARLLYQVLVEKWIVLCSNSKHYKKMFLNKVISIHPSVYLNILSKKVRKYI